MSLFLQSLFTALEERARKIEQYRAAKMNKTVELGKLRRKGESIAVASKSLVRLTSVLSKEQQAKLAADLLTKLQKAKAIGQLRKSKLDTKAGSKIPMTSLKDLSPKTRALRQQEMRALKEKQMKVIEDMKNKDKKLTIPKQIQVPTKFDKDGIIN